jgi:pyruvate decarboxylase
MASPDIRTKELRQPIDVAEYLFRRLHEVGVRAVHGVPGTIYLSFQLSNNECFNYSPHDVNITPSTTGDYNLAALDYIPKCGLDWVGNCNELNAGE